MLEEYDQLAVEVTAVERSHDSSWYAEGLDEAGDLIAFAGDWRAMQAIADELEAGQTVLALIEPWQRVAVRPGGVPTSSTIIPDHPDRPLHSWGGSPMR